MKTRSSIRYAVVVFLWLALIGCEKNSDENSEGEDLNLEPVEDVSVAKSLVEDIADGVMVKVMDELSNHRTYSQHKIYGISGSAILSGIYASDTDIDCGYDCLKSQHNINLVILFSDYNVMVYDTCEVTITGTVGYSNNSWSRQSGDNHTSGGFICLSGYEVSFKIVMDNSWGYQDVITFYVKGCNGNSLSGSCTGGNEVTYNF